MAFFAHFFPQKKNLCTIRNVPFFLAKLDKTHQIINYIFKNFKN